MSRLRQIHQIANNIVAIVTISAWYVFFETGHQAAEVTGVFGVLYLLAYRMIKKEMDNFKE